MHSHFTIAVSSMAGSQGYFSSHQGYGATVDQGYNFSNQRQQNAGATGGATGNCQTNIFNFYFVNPGTYTVHMSSSGFQGLGGQASGQGQASHHSNSTNAQTGMAPIGMVSQPQCANSPHAIQPFGGNVAMNPFTSRSTAQVVLSQPSSVKAETSMSSGGSFQTCANGNGDGFKQMFSRRKTPVSNFKCYDSQEFWSQTQSYSDDDED